MAIYNIHSLFLLEVITSFRAACLVHLLEEIDSSFSPAPDVLSTTTDESGVHVLFDVCHLQLTKEEPESQKE